MSCKTNIEEMEEKKRQEMVQDELDKLLNDDDDPFLNEYMKKRMAEMMEEVQLNRSGREFGRLIRLTKAEDFLEAIEKEAKDVLIICHIANESYEGCISMNGCLSLLAPEYQFIKFCTLDARAAGMSERFVSIQAFQPYQFSFTVISICLVVSKILSIDLSTKYPAN